MLPILDSIRDNPEKFPNLVNVNFLWSVRGLKIYNVFENRLNDSIPNSNDTTYPGKISFKTLVYNTSIEDTSLVIGNSPTVQLQQTSSVKNGRPSIDDIMKIAIGDNVRNGCLLMCGPIGMTRPAEFRAIEVGLDFHTEKFGW